MGLGEKWNDLQITNLKIQNAVPFCRNVIHTAVKKVFPVLLIENIAF